MPEPSVPTETDACVCLMHVLDGVCVCVFVQYGDLLASRQVQLVLCQQRALENYTADGSTILGKSRSKVLLWENMG